MSNAQLKVQSTGQVDITSKTTIVGSSYGDMVDIKNNCQNVPVGSDLIWGYFSQSQTNNPGLLSLRSYDGCRFVVKNNGYVGIGTSTPQAGLEVTSDIRCVSLHQMSDIRLKSNIAKLDSKVDLLYSINGLSYNFKNNDRITNKSNSLDDKTESNNAEQTFDSKTTSRKHLGFSAQEVRNVYPELVYEDDNGILSIDYVSFIPIIVEVLKEQKRTIAQLEKKIDAIENTKKNVLVKK